MVGTPRLKRINLSDGGWRSIPNPFYYVFMNMDEPKIYYPNIEGEMDEIKRVSQYLTRNEDFPVSVYDIISSLENSNEVTLSDELWSNLENTESNEIEIGDFNAVFDIANHYGKSDPNKLKRKLESGDYERPMIVKFGDRYHLVSGNTRLSTAAAMGMNPKVFIGDLNDIDENPISENIKRIKSLLN